MYVVNKMLDAQIYENNKILSQCTVVWHRCYYIRVRYTNAGKGRRQY